jgi:hypothetical protein
MGVWRAFLLLAAAPIARGIVEEYYTTNAACRQKNCINPIFPGFLQLDDLAELPWQKMSLEKNGHYLEFCKNIVDYDFALPIIDWRDKWNFTAHTIPERIESQDRDAAKLFFYHLSAMGIEAWDYPEPHQESNLPMSSCAKQVARMACFTYLPMANGEVGYESATKYFRPCKSSCENYVRECNVECCDDSVQCVFVRQTGSVEQLQEDKENANENTELPAHRSMTVTGGYANVSGPSTLCTGGATLPHSLTALTGLAAIFFVLRGF